MRIDEELLNTLGLAELKPEAKTSLLKHLVEELELNVGTVIAAKLNDDQIEQFEKLIDGGDQAQALAWLQQNYPDYKQVVQAELEKLKEQIKTNAPAILEADQAA